MAEPSPPAEIRWGGATLTVDRGRISGLDRGGAPVLSGFDVRVRWLDPHRGSVELVGDEAVHRLDQDEIESVWTLGEGRTVTVRHNFDRTWSVRVLIVNGAAEPLELDLVRIEAVPGPGFAGWCWGSGALGRLALISTQGDDNLVFTVQRGSLLAESRDLEPGGEDAVLAADLGPLRLPAGSRRVVSLRGEWLRPGQFLDDLPSWLPLLELAAGEPLQLGTPDLALSVPDDTSVEETGDIVEVLPDGGVGARELVLTGASGTIILDAVWAPPLAVALAETASSALDNAERRQGVACLDAVSAVVLQRSSLGGTDVDDALDRALEMTPPGNPWSIVLWATAHTQTGRADYLRRAADAVRVLPARPGCGVAAMHLVVAQLTAGPDPEIGLRVLARLAGEVGDAATALELAVVGAPVRMPIQALARRALAELGAGMPGRPGLAAAEIAQRVAALRLVEATNAMTSLDAPGSAPPGVGPQRVGVLVQSWTRRLLVEHPTAEVLAWLTTDVDT